MAGKNTSGPDFADVAALEAEVSRAPTVWHVLLGRILLLIVRELRLLRAGVRS